MGAHMTTFDDLWVWEDSAIADSLAWYREVAARMLTQCDFCR